nr:hypothetical protein [Tanacetum cinerariifolium]
INRHARFSDNKIKKLQMILDYCESCGDLHGSEGCVSLGASVSTTSSPRVTHSSISYYEIRIVSTWHRSSVDVRLLLEFPVKLRGTTFQNEHSRAIGAVTGPPAGPPALVASLLTLSCSFLIAASIPSRTS